MRLIQAKIRGTGLTLATGWFEIHRQTTAICITDAAARTCFLRGLHAITPDELHAWPDLFAHTPRLVSTKDHLRKIMPHKRTIAMGIFAASPELVKELGLLCPDLYETDRIEIGRRLDSSRWLNFVEISSSTRWGEICQDIQPVLDSPEASAIRYRFLRTLLPTDRVKGKIHDELIRLLNDFSTARTDYADTVAQLRESIRRVDYFQEARNKVYRQLPRTYLLNRTDNPVINPELAALKNEAHNACVKAREAGHAPIFLIDSPEKILLRGNKDLLASFIRELSSQGQVIFVTGDAGLFALTPNQANYTAEQLADGVGQEEMV